MTRIGNEHQIGAADLTPEDFALWRHHPVSKVFLRFLADQAANWREVAMALWEDGTLHKQPDRPDLDSDFLRGQVTALVHAERIGLAEIQQFYAGKTEAEQPEEDL